MLMVNRLVGFGRRRAVAAGAISLVSSSSSTSDNPTLPAHSTGDLICVLSLVRNTATPPNEFSGFTTPAGGTFSQGSSTDSAAGRFCYKYAASGSETLSGGSASATDRTVMWVLSGMHPSAPIGAIDTNVGDSNTATLGPLTLAAASSWVLTGIASDSATTPGAVSGMTEVVRVTSFYGGHIGPTATFTSRTSSVGSADWGALAVEILAA